MARAKIYECQSCGKPTAEYIKNGYFKCKDRDCGAIWWDIFDRPSGVNGYKCYNCNHKTLQSITQIGNVNVRRCSNCGKTLLELIH